MRLGQVIEIVDGRALNEFNHAREVEYGFETALLSDVLAHAKPHTTLMITEITNPQVVRTAEMVDAVGVLVVKNKMPRARLTDLDGRPGNHPRSEIGVSRCSGDDARSGCGHASHLVTRTKRGDAQASHQRRAGRG